MASNGSERQPMSPGALLKTLSAQSPEQSFVPTRISNASIASTACIRVQSVTALPSALDATVATTSTSSNHFTLSKVSSLWERVWPDEMKGKYTLARLQAFHKYRQTRPLWWKVLVILVTPLPVTLLVASLNWFPLVSPKEGWRANYLVFVRAFLESHICASTFKSQRQFFFADDHTTLHNALIMRTVAAVVPPCLLLLVSSQIAFPMPFGLLISIFLSAPFMVMAVRFSIKKTKPPKSPPRPSTSRVVACTNGAYNAPDEKPKDNKTDVPSDQPAVPAVEFPAKVEEWTRMFLFNMSLVFIFPVYQVGYNKLEAHATIQLFYFLLLPTILRKMLVVWHRRHCKCMPDVSNEAIVFSAKFFVALFKCVFLGMSGWFRTLLVMMWDCGELGFCVMHIAHDAREIEKFVEKAGPKCMGGDDDYVAHCVQFVALNRLLVVENANQLQVQETGVIDSALYQTDLYATLRSKWRWGYPHGQFKRCGSISIYVNNNGDRSSVTESATTEDSGVNRITRVQRDNMQLLDKTLGMLFALEYIVLVEFVEALIPLFYVAYMELSFHSPCRHFLRHVMNLDRSSFDHTVLSMLTYASVELLSFLVLGVFVKQRFRIDSIDLLAFVLETHFINIQAKLVLFLIIVLSFQLVHYVCEVMSRNKQSIRDLDIV